MLSCIKLFTRKKYISITAGGLLSIAAFILSVFSLYLNTIHYNEEQRLNNIQRFQLHRNMFFDELRILEKGLKHVEFFEPRETYLVFFPRNDLSNVVTKVTQSDLDEGSVQDYDKKEGARKAYREDLSKSLKEIPSDIHDLQREVKLNGYSDTASALIGSIKGNINASMWQMGIKIHGQDSVQHMAALQLNISKDIEYITTIISALFHFASYHDFKENFGFSKKIIEFSFLKSNLGKYKSMLNDNQFRLLNIILSMQELIITNNMAPSKQSKKLLWKNSALITYMKNETQLKKHIEMLVADIDLTYIEYDNFTNHRNSFNQLMSMKNSLIGFH